jgi:hypothetical protein
MNVAASARAHLELDAWDSTLTMRLKVEGPLLAQVPCSLGWLLLPGRSLLLAPSVLLRARRERELPDGEVLLSMYLLRLRRHRLLVRVRAPMKVDSRFLLVLA